MIDIMRRYLAPADPVLLVPPGDDAAVLMLPPGPKLEVLTTDLLVEGTHFLPGLRTCWYSLGRRALVANLSDLAAMGAVPAAGLLSVGLPPDFRLAALEDLYRGLADEAAVWGLRLVGGDTVRSAQVALNVTVTGYKGLQEASCTRSACTPGDYLYVSGVLGGCRAGLELLLGGVCPETASLEESALIERQQRPVPRLPLGRVLATRFVRVAAMDVSDGVVTDLARMAAASQVAFQVRVSQVPLYLWVAEYCNSRNKVPAHFALSSGEEFELLFACALEPAEVAAIVAETPVDCDVTCIGRAVVGSGVVFISETGHSIELHDSGFSHFAAG